MGLLVKGNRVSFLYAKKTRELVLSSHLCIVHDVSNQFAEIGIRSCDFFIVETGRNRGPISSSNLGMRKAASDYYGSLDNLCEVSVDLPLDGWEHFLDADAIRYTRSGFLGNHYEHTYDFQQPLYYCEEFDVFKIVSPDFCQATPAGFEWP